METRHPQLTGCLTAYCSSSVSVNAVASAGALGELGPEVGAGGPLVLGLG